MNEHSKLARILFDEGPDSLIPAGARTKFSPLACSCSLATNSRKRPRLTMTNKVWVIRQQILMDDYRLYKCLTTGGCQWFYMNIISVIMGKVKCG